MSNTPRVRVSFDFGDPTSKINITIVDNQRDSAKQFFSCLSDAGYKSELVSWK